MNTPTHRKFFITIFALLLFTAIVIIRPAVDVLSLGIALAGIAFAHNAPNAAEKFANRGKPDEKTEN